MDNVLLLIIMFCVHWFGDFLLQPSNMSINKTKSFSLTLKHSIIYTSSFFIASLIMTILNILKLDVLSLLIFLGVTFITHTLIDFYLCRVAYKVMDVEDPNTFLGLMELDQILHYIQLLITYAIIFT